MMKTIIATSILTMSFSAMSANDEYINLASLDADAQLARVDAEMVSVKNLKMLLGFEQKLNLSF